MASFRESLRSNYTFLLDNVPVDDVKDILFERKVLEWKDLDHIDASTSKKQACRLLVRLLYHKTEAHFQIFCEALGKLSRPDIAEQLKVSSTESTGQQLQQVSREPLEMGMRELKRETSDLRERLALIETHINQEGNTALQMDRRKHNKRQIYYEFEPNKRMHTESDDESVVSSTNDEDVTADNVLAGSKDYLSNQVETQGLRKELQGITGESKVAKSPKMIISHKYILSNTDKCELYTGLKLATFDQLLRACRDDVIFGCPDTNCSNISHQDELILTLFKMNHNTNFHLLDDMFCLFLSSSEHIFYKWMKILSSHIYFKVKKNDNIMLYPVLDMTRTRSVLGGNDLMLFDDINDVTKSWLEKPVSKDQHLESNRNKQNLAVSFHAVKTDRGYSFVKNKFDQLNGKKLRYFINSLMEEDLWIDVELPLINSIVLVCGALTNSFNTVAFWG